MSTEKQPAEVAEVSDADRALPSPAPSNPPAGEQPPPDSSADIAQTNGKSGPKPVLDVDKRGRVCGMIAMGSSRREAAKAVGCHVSTISRTMQRDPEFAEQVHDAEVLSRTRPLAAIYQAINTNWRAAAWLLERTRPDEFARRKPKTYTQRDLREVVDRLLAHTLGKIPSEANREYVEEIADQLAQPPDDVVELPENLQDLIRRAAVNKVEFEARERKLYDLTVSPDPYEEPYDADTHEYKSDVNEEDVAE